MLARAAIKLAFVLLLFFNIIALLMLASASAQDKPETKIVIAVADFQNNSGKSEFDHYSKAIPSSIITNLAAFGQFTIVERSQLKAALDELALSMQGIVDTQIAAKVGKFVGVTLLIIGDFVIIGNTILINTRLVEVTTSKVRAGISQRGTLDNLLTLLDKISDAILEELQVEIKPRGVENQLPTAAFTFSPQHPANGDPITFDASNSSDSDGDIVLYEWDFTNDGVVDKIGKVVSETLFFPGQYLVTLKVTDNQGGSNSTSQTIQVKEGQNVEISELVITSDPSGAMIFINGEFKGATPKIIIVRKGSYDIVLRKENYEEWRKEISVEGNQRKEFFVQLIKKTENHPPTAAFHFAPSLPAEDDIITFDASGSGDPDGFIVDYKWDFDGDGVTDAWGLRVYKQFSRGQYTVTLTVIDNEGISGSYRKELEVRKQHIILQSSARFDSLEALAGELILSGFSVFDFDFVIWSSFSTSGFSDIRFDIIRQIIDIKWLNLTSTTTLDVSGSSISERLRLSISISENLTLTTSAAFNLFDFYNQYGHIALQATEGEARLQVYTSFRSGRFSEGWVSINEIYVGDFTISGHIFFYYGGLDRLVLSVRTKFMEVDFSSTTVFDARGFSTMSLEVSEIKIANLTFSSDVKFGRTGFDRLTARLVTNTMKDSGNIIIAVDSQAEFYPDRFTIFVEIKIVI